MATHPFNIESPDVKLKEELSVLRKQSNIDSSYHCQKSQRLLNLENTWRRMEAGDLKFNIGRVVLAPGAQGSENVSNMERYVRVSMKDYMITINDLNEYIEYFPKKIRASFKDHVENILNLNGHSLMLKGSTEESSRFNPEVLASFFVPIMESAGTKNNLA
eukprot:jgi/Bigna1/86845/estExt_fgenesh1_pg.C_140132